MFTMEDLTGGSTGSLRVGCCPLEWESVKNLPEMQETWQMQLGSLGREDPLEEGMAIHYSILTWRIPWTEEPGGLQSLGP